MIEFGEIPTNGGYGSEVNVELNGELCHWVYSFSEKTDYSEASINAFYFEECPTKSPIPIEYGRYIQYADCLIDTNSSIFRERASAKSSWDQDEQPKEISSFLKYVNKITKIPKYDEKNKEEYYADYYEWDSLKFIILDSISKDQKFRLKLKIAYNKAVTNNYSNEELEEYVARYLSKKEALELKRNRIVIGGCSMDNSPRQHALNIAILSAETINWEVFLKAHLNIMNDYFQRVSDGSYAYKGRQTYIKELEELDINVLDMLLGTVLRFDQQSKHHYYGSISRVGRALAESKEKNELENRLFSILENNKLDDYNRMLIYYLISNYSYNLEDESHRVEVRKKLKKSVLSLPDYLAQQINVSLK